MTFEVLVGSTKSVIGVGLIKQLSNEFFGWAHEGMGGVFHERREFERVGHDVVIDLLHIVSVDLDEGVLSGQQLIEDSPERPKVSTVGVALVDEDFRGHVLRCSDEAKGPALIFAHLFASAHVHQLQVAVPADHDIFWLEISVDDGLLVKNLHHVDQ
jgi:hypothetical protein